MQCIKSLTSHKSCVLFFFCMTLFVYFLLTVMKTNEWNLNKYSI